MRTMLRALLATVVLIGALAAGPVGPAGAAERDPGGGGEGSSLPRPDSGQEPEDSGDRGGAAQLGLFGVLVAGTAFISAMVVRDVRRTRRRTGRAQADGSRPEAASASATTTVSTAGRRDTGSDGSPSR